MSGRRVELRMFECKLEEDLIGSLDGVTTMPPTRQSQAQDKFRGCLLGALVGDCIGTLFECDYTVSYKILSDLYTSLTNLSEGEKMEIEICSKMTMKDVLDKRKLSLLTQRMSILNPKAEEFRPGPKRHSSFEAVEPRRQSIYRPIERYSDDYVMTRSVVLSLIKMKGFDLKAVAKQLTEDYFLNLTRKYGRYIRGIFVLLRDDNYCDPHGPAKKAETAPGSQSNEAASRVSPIALYGWSGSITKLIDMTTKLCKITNYNKYGLVGALIQTLAVYEALNWNVIRKEESKRRESFPRMKILASKTSPLLRRKKFRIQEQGSPAGGSFETTSKNGFDYKSFCYCVMDGVGMSSKLETLKHLLHPHRDSGKSVELAYTEKILTIIEFLDRENLPSRAEVVEKLGNGIKAIDSVPTALYVFLAVASDKALEELQMEVKSPILRCIFYAISLGGDSDTIASMAGSIAGAYWGFREIPVEILRVCEDSENAMDLADSLYNLVEAQP